MKNRLFLPALVASALCCFHVGCTTTHLECRGFVLDRTSVLQNIYAKVTLPDGTVVEYANDGGIIAAKSALDAAAKAAVLLAAEQPTGKPPKVK